MMEDTIIGSVGTKLTLDHIRRVLDRQTQPIYNIPIVLTDDEFEAVAAMYSVRNSKDIDDFRLPGWEVYRMRPRHKERIEGEEE